MQLPDIQDEVDSRGIAIDGVGVSRVRYPVRFSDGATLQSAVASIDVTVGLPAERRGTHMSRMLELVDEQLREFDPRELPTVLKAFASRLDVDKVRLRIALPIAFEVATPVSGLRSQQVCDVAFVAAIRDSSVSLRTKLSTEVMSLCPCSKAISDYGAHNQRSRVSLSIHGAAEDVYPVSVHRQFDMIRQVGSCPVYPIIKRVDERDVTMRAHDNPAFVEDMARDLSAACRQLGVAHGVVVRNLESIHSHDAIARISWSPPAS